MSAAPEPERLRRQLEFLVEIDRLKQVERQTNIVGDHRRENTAEHSWHLALFALVLAEWSDAHVDVSRVVELCLVHDLVEIDAGDTFAYDDAAYADKRDREGAAARRIFGLLPEDQQKWLWARWEEYEEAATPESRFAHAVDRLQPVLLNSLSGEQGPWRRHGIRHDQAVARNQVISEGSAVLWEVARARLDEATRRGHLSS